MPYAQAFAQGSQTSNEQGLYFGFEYLPFSKMKISAYCDFFYFPWLKFGVSEPSKGANYFIENAYTISSLLTISARYSFLNRGEDLSGSNAVLKPVVETNIQKIRFQANFALSQSFLLRNRIEWVLCEKQLTPNQLGFMFYQDIGWKPNMPKISINARYAVFETQGWESSIYTYENDLLYSYSVPALSGRGIRTYLLVNYTPFKILNISVRYSLTSYFDRTVIGDGPTELVGNRKSDLYFQLRLLF
jgi:hypothetical protein